MTNLVLISQEREKKTTKAQKQLINGLAELLAKAESGELKAVCYASLDTDGEQVTLGALQGGDVGTHEFIGLSQMLCDSLICASRD